MYRTDYCLNRGRVQNKLSAQENAERFKQVESLGTGTEWTKREGLRPALPIVRFLHPRLAGNYPARHERRHTNLTGLDFRSNGLTLAARLNF